MAIEKKWPAVAPVLFTASGTARGKITLASTLGFKVKQAVVLVNSVQGRLVLEVKRVTKTYILAGPPGKIDDYADLSAWDNTTIIYADEQPKKLPTDKELELAVYEQEPTVAKRVIAVDPNGDFFSKDNPFPIDGNVDVTVNSVQVFTKPFDFIACVYSAPEQEIYTSKIGGPSGTPLQQVTINYVDSSKNQFLNLYRIDL